jgi:tripartite-type tricarboxylate transporter receptor subunit TctC
MPFNWRLAMNRRDFLNLAAGAAVLPALPRTAAAQAYPAKPIRLLVGFAAGGGQDILARLIGNWLSERLGQQVVIENRPGQAASIAAEAVVRSAPDGYTLYFVGPNNAINATLYDNLSFDIVKDFQHIAAMVTMPNVMSVHPGVPAKTVPEFIAHAKANPGKVNFASGGVGTSVHVSGELFKQMTGIQMQHVSYRGAGPANIDLLAGQVQVMFDNLNSQIGHIRQGKLRALAVTTTSRSPELPDVPTVAETVPGYEASAFFGVSAPRNIPRDVLAKLNSEINAGLRDPRLKVRFDELGATTRPGTPEDFTKLIADEVAKWAPVVRASGAKPG